MAINTFMVEVKVILKGLCIFTTDLRADRLSDWYRIRSVSLVMKEHHEVKMKRKSMTALLKARICKHTNWLNNIK